MNQNTKVCDVLPALSAKLSGACEEARQDIAEYFKIAAVPLSVVKLVNQLEYATFLLNLPIGEVGQPDDPEPAKKAITELSDAITEITRLSVEISKIRDQVRG